MFRLLALSTLALVAAIASTKVAFAEVIGFDAHAPNHLRLMDHRTGKHYIVALEPDPDVHGTIDVVLLVLTREGGTDQNLLAPFGIYHGLQPYDLAALDLRRGAAGSTFGAVRRIPIRRTATKLVVTIEDVQVHEVSDVPLGEGGSQEITSLRLNVSLEDGRPLKSE